MDPDVSRLRSESTLAPGRATAEAELPSCIRSGEISQLPKSHTCFNRLDLPPYPDFETYVPVQVVRMTVAGKLTLYCYTTDWTRS